MQPVRTIEVNVNARVVNVFMRAPRKVEGDCMEGAVSARVVRPNVELTGPLRWAGFGLGF